MAEEAAVSFLLEQVTAVIKGYADLISEADKEFKKLKEDVEELKNILQDMENSKSEESYVVGVQNQIRELIYQVEDTIDSWLTRAAASKSKGPVRRGFGKLSPNHFNLAKEVKNLRQGEIKEMKEKANALKVARGSLLSPKAADHSKEPKSDPFIRQEKVVGLKDEEEKITGYLMADQEELDIISIIGMPGLGKTTLAWKIFNHPSLSHAYPIRIWVHFSQRFNSRDVLLQIIKHFVSANEDVSRKSNQELTSEIHACLKKERFLLVMDDVWKEDHWDDIKKALPYSNGSGKILITSREMGVGRHVQHITPPHEQRFLYSNESWELLQLEVFGDLTKCPIELRGIGKLIADECKGVPLTIVVIGGVLKDHYLKIDSDVQVRTKWEEIAKNVDLGLEDKVKVINDVVALSYDRVPERLRDCFLYLGVFPAGCHIPSWMLTRLWIAEGFIQPDQNKTMEKTAEDNLNDLISRNLLIVHKANLRKEVKLCRVHDLIRVFCISKASKRNLCQEVKMEEDKQALAEKMKIIHRLCVHSDLDNFFSASVPAPSVRSFICFRKDVMDLEPEHNSVISDNFEKLRILQAKSIRFNKFPQGIPKLKHLRYIVLCIADLKIIPDPISQLWNLQTIFVDTNSDVLTMKANIWKMVRLRHVKTKAAVFLENAAVGEGGENLQTLDRLSPESVTENFVRKASNLKTLGIRGKFTTLFESMSLEKLTKLEKLKLYQVLTETRLQRFPNWQCFPVHLKRLTLANTFLDWKHMSTVAMIGDLEVIKLKDNAFTGIKWSAVDYVFKNLQILLIVISDLVLWEASPSTFPYLRHLVLKNCERLNEIPDCVLKPLNSLELERVRKPTADSAKNSGYNIKLTVGPGCDIA